jgi:ABC-type lipoprotein release transport system permease subunit
MTVMALPLRYNLRNLTVRRASNLLAALGIALVVMVMIWVLALAQGFRIALAGTGRADRALLMRGGATSEVQSGIDREAADIVRVMPEIVPGTDGRPLASAELLVIVGLPKKSDGSVANVAVRGVSPQAFALRPELRLTAGRLFEPGTAQVIVGLPLASRTRDCEVGSRLRFAGQEWEVVGQFATGGSGFESEIWGDAETMIPAFERDVYQSMTVQLRTAADLAALEQRIAADPRLNLKVQSELAYYESQSRQFTTFIRVIGVTIALLMSFGAVAGALNTMFAAVNSRTREIGTLLALGFSRWSVLLAFMIESVLLATVGGLLGCALGLLVNGASTGTTNWESFSEVAFAFRVTPPILVAGLCFAILMGAVGGLLPAARAARKRVAESLRAA